jgi:hypothetical protein
MDQSHHVRPDMQTGVQQHQDQHSKSLVAYCGRGTATIETRGLRTLTLEGKENEVREVYR